MVDLLLLYWPEHPIGKLFVVYVFAEVLSDIGNNFFASFTATAVFFIGVGFGWTGEFVEQIAAADQLIVTWQFHDGLLSLRKVMFLVIVVLQFDGLILL
jgi:hypothetical protein